MRIGMSLVRNLFTRPVLTGNDFDCNSTSSSTMIKLFVNVSLTNSVVVFGDTGLSNWDFLQEDFSQLMRLWYLPHRRPAKAQESLHICAVSPEPSLFAHIKYGSRRRIQPKIRHLAPLDSCACALEE